MAEEKKRRNVYSPKFKAQVALEALRGTRTTLEIGEAYSVHPVQVRQWKKIVEEHADTLFEGKRGRKPIRRLGETDELFREIRRLQREVRQLKKN